MDDGQDKKVTSERRTGVTEAQRLLPSASMKGASVHPSQCTHPLKALRPRANQTTYWTTCTLCLSRWVREKDAPPSVYVAGESKFPEKAKPNMLAHQESEAEDPQDNRVLAFSRCKESRYVEMLLGQPVFCEWAIKERKPEKRPSLQLQEFTNCVRRNYHRAGTPAPATAGTSMSLT
ncbi:MAG: hypothetical protein ACKPKO_14880, partial [Candidatus Fonsibacter sp.]